MRCAGCNHEFEEQAVRQAGIAVFGQGDEYIYSYFRCGGCHRYTVRVYCDSFTGDASISFLPPVSREQGERAVAVIRACPDPMNKFCDCPAHREMICGVPSI